MMYKVQVQMGTGQWADVAGAGGAKGYVRGWYDALTSLLPRPAYRVCAGGLVVEQDIARKAPQVANGGLR